VILSTACRKRSPGSEARHNMSAQRNAEPFCRRQSITFQQTELEQLESKLRKMEVELQEKQSQLPFTCHDGSGSGHRSTQRRKGLEAILEPDARENGEEENTAKATSATRRPSAAADTRPLSSSSHSNDSIPRQVVQKRRKTVDSRTRNLPSRGRS
jgi:hypothetical protein